MIDGRFDAALVAYQKCMKLGGGVCASFLAASEFGRGDNEAALDALRLTEQVSTVGSNTFGFVTYMYGLLG